MAEIKGEAPRNLQNSFSHLSNSWHRSFMLTPLKFTLRHWKPKVGHGYSEISLWMVVALFFDYNLSLKLLYTPGKLTEPMFFSIMSWTKHVFLLQHHEETSWIYLESCFVSFSWPSSALWGFGSKWWSLPVHETLKKNVCFFFTSQNESQKLQKQ